MRRNRTGLTLKQQLTRVSGSLRVEGRDLPLEDARLRGEHLSFRLAGHKGEFSGTVKDGGKDYTESGMNTLSVGKAVPETATTETFKQNEFRLLIVANKFQTGFDQPLGPVRITGEFE